MEDRRLFTRIDARLPIKFKDAKDGREGVAETVNISANGLGLVTKENIVIKSSLEIWLYIPDHHAPLYVKGEVVWSVPLNGTNLKRLGLRLEKEELMGLGRALWVNCATSRIYK